MSLSRQIAATWVFPPKVLNLGNGPVNLPGPNEGKTKDLPISSSLDIAESVFSQPAAGKTTLSFW